MPTPWGRWADPNFRKAYASVVSAGAQSVCAPFWWSVPELEQSVVQVVHPIVTTGRVRGARERASHISDSLAVPS
jgi:hypothetical protein